MLNKYILRAVATAAALTCAAGPASADNFRILMLDYAFFPEISYVQPGDTITFVNISGVTRVIKSSDGAWETPEMADGSETTVPVFEGMKNDYIAEIDGVGDNGGSSDSADTNDDQTDDSTVDGQGDDESTILGKLNFSGAPVVAEN